MSLSQSEKEKEGVQQELCLNSFSKTSMGTSSHKFRGPKNIKSSNGPAGAVEQQEKCSWNQEWLQCRGDSGQHPRAG